MTRALATLAALILIALALSTSSSQNGTFLPPLASSTGVDVIESLTTETLLERYKNWTQRTANRTKRVLSFTPVAPTLVYDRPGRYNLEHQLQGVHPLGATVNVTRTTQNQQNGARALPDPRDSSRAQMETKALGRWNAIGCGWFVQHDYWVWDAQKH